MKSRNNYLEDEKKRDKGRRRSFIISESVGVIAGLIAAAILLAVAIAIAYAMAQRFGFASVSFGTMIIVAVFIFLIVILNIADRVVHKLWPTNTHDDWEDANRDNYP